MPFLDAFSRLPLLVLGIGVVKEIDQVLVQLRLIQFDDGQLVPSIGMHAGAPLLLRMHRIATNQAAFHQCRVDERRRRVNAG